MSRARVRSEGEQHWPPEPPQVGTRSVLLATAGLGALLVLGIVLAWLLLRWNGVDPSADRGDNVPTVEARGTLRGFSERRQTSTAIDEPPAIPQAMAAVAARRDPYAPLSEAEIDRFRSPPEAAREGRP